MDDLPRFLGDGLSIAALSIIASISWTAWKRVADDAQVPMKFGRDGQPSWRMAKKPALLLSPALATLILLLPTLTRATFTTEGQEAWMLFSIRAVLAGGFAMAHVMTMKNAMEVLEQEGKLRP